MIKYIRLFFLIFLLSCTSNKKVFWCGDHVCINKEEKRNYFKKNLIVEVKDTDKNKFEDKSMINEIILQGKLHKKNNLKDPEKEIKLTYKEKRKKIKEEKRMAKLRLKQERQRIKDEKNLEKELKKEELLRIKNKKKLTKKYEELKKREQSNKKDNKIVKILDANIEKKEKVRDFEFKNIVKVISDKSNTKSFPDINRNFE